ncbi:MAG: transcriptional repressor [Beijerinckiaceae bacterium]|jgi:Fur family zinc uptake transcriptional regulator|nr:transcriptional repressor [Beijerinckiaceae bacterium]
MPQPRPPLPALAAPARPLSATQVRILDLLSQAQRPLSAYDLLGKLRSEGVNAPPTVYRALERLMREGLAHRIESLNAFIACNMPHHHDLAAFAICDHCGTVAEVRDTDVEARLGHVAARSGFHVTKATVELHGHCAACSGKAHGHASARETGHTP